LFFDFYVKRCLINK